MFVVNGTKDNNNENATVSLQTITTGDVIGNQVTVTSGLQGGERIVVNGTTQIKDQQTVRIVP